MSRLQQHDLTIAYGDSDPVLRSLSGIIEDATITGIIGANGSGKTTLLRACARLIRPKSGAILLDGEDIHRLPTREVARRLGLMRQRSQAPEAITVEDLVRRGRYPHQEFFSTPTQEDEIAVTDALARTGIPDLRSRSLDELSGGQRQRAWMAMALAQDTDILLLDEPTTYLDLSHRHDMLKLLSELKTRDGKTVVCVLHDVNDAADICERVIGIKDGTILVHGATEDVITPETLFDIYGIENDILSRGSSARPFMLPLSRILDGYSQVGSDTEPDCATEPPGSKAAISLQGVHAGYEDRPVLRDIGLEIPAGKISVIIGPNACGKSTLLRTAARLLALESGELSFPAIGDRGLEKTRDRKRFARRISFLEQSTAVPDDIRVEDLVTIGRYPYQRWYAQWSRDDRREVEESMALVDISELRDRAVGSLSGGQLRRAMLAMTMAQNADVMLLDEPTTFLDIAHQVEVLDICLRLNRNEGRSIVMVLHDLWQAMRYADHLVVMDEGRIIRQGTPDEIARSGVLESVFRIDLHFEPDPRGRGVLPLPMPLEEATAINAE
ncbi:ABC transporter ATP-binding protein [Salinispira pacifica]|uniref:ABC-type Fe3+-siderophore transport system, ATPase component n=1 Tax=Salinispira pacifica TaxID=1307761 RepID=V5WFV3_9SPIO|nr:ABC transporter ATP-binding protein [Salinispira pacifica]AHC14026.1 ABC-type Fe3+-siderophore transport system, ATPase component [Salinispira pacifica]